MPLIVHPTTLRDVKLLEPMAFDDARGFFAGRADFLGENPKTKVANCGIFWSRLRSH